MPPLIPAPVIERLGDFLSWRRGQLDPADVGLPGGGRRRVPGLRRAEVAGLAAISTDHYLRLEQGRRMPSVPVLEALARALRLSGNERRYLFELAGKVSAKPACRQRQCVLPPLKRLLDQLMSPAVVLGHRMDVLAWNRQASALLTDFGKLPPRRRNFAMVLFTDPAVRRLYADWPRAGRGCVSMLRMEAGQAVDDAELAALVAELAQQDSDFLRWWAEHHVAALTGGLEVLDHPVVGRLNLRWDALTHESDPGQQLVVLTADPGSSSDVALRRLAS